ncbi:hypothetical protein HF998_10720 [Cellulomonas hominis]|uniref:Uncharacterized protein n=1 Tax=Cellulomonas hominis TaxID=156981 RepID=A0A7W8SEX7_9CELL|nr:hypothetical protein [Cellulomonas hominis]MBB5473842.1 hypothetical protein [Cellulomonas hominis]NKY07438.1 hypothetical protein [Cellulomonas hominis]
MLRLLLAFTSGVLATSIVLLATGIGDGGLPWVVPVAAVVGAILLTLVSIGTTLAGVRAPREKDVEAAVRENRISLARVLETRATGSSVNDQPVCDIRLVVASRTRPAYTTTTRALVNLGSLPVLQGGAVVVVAQLHADRPEVALLDPAPADWRDAAQRDTTVRTMPEAPVWEAPPAPGRDRRGLLRIPGVLLVVAFLAGVGLRAWPERDVVTSLAQGTSLSDAVAQRDRDRAEAASIFPAVRTREVVDDLAEVAGGTQFTEVLLFQTYAVAEALTTPGAQTTDRFVWRDGGASRDGAATIQPDPAELPDELFDVTQVDWSVVERLTAQAAELTGIDDADGPTVIVRRSTTDEGAPLQVVVSVDDDYRDAWLTADASGNVVEMRGGAPGSASAAWEAEHQG